MVERFSVQSKSHGTPVVRDNPTHHFAALNRPGFGKAHERNRALLSQSLMKPACVVEFASIEPGEPLTDTFRTGWGVPAAPTSVPVPATAAAAGGFQGSCPVPASSTAIAF